MKTPKPKEMTLRLHPDDAAQVDHLADAAGWTDAAIIRHLMRIGFARLAKDHAGLDLLTVKYDMATAEAKIRKDADRRIAELKNIKPQKAGR
jgi:hypothetical protein